MYFNPITIYFTSFKISWRKVSVFMGMIYRNVALSLNRSVLYLYLHNEAKAFFENVFEFTQHCLALIIYVTTAF